MNFESTFIQTIDFNGAGRPDVLDAHKTDWTVYLNYPGPNGEPTWVVKTINTDRIRKALRARGFANISSTTPLPVSRSITGLDVNIQRCLVLHSDGEWRDCPDDPDLPPDEVVFTWEDQYTLVEYSRRRQRRRISGSRGQHLAAPISSSGRIRTGLRQLVHSKTSATGSLDISPGTVPPASRGRQWAFKIPRRRALSSRFTSMSITTRPALEPIMALRSRNPSLCRAVGTAHWSAGPTRG